MKNTSAGIFFYCTHTNRFLYLMRSDSNYAWGVPGGKIENDETIAFKAEFFRQSRESQAWLFQIYYKKINLKEARQSKPCLIQRWTKNNKTDLELVKKELGIKLIE